MPWYPRVNGVGPLIREAREARGLSQPALAKMLGIRSNYLSMIENGTKSVSGERLYKFAAALKIPPAERNRWMAAAEHLPAELWALLIRNPDRWDDVAALLSQQPVTKSKPKPSTKTKSKKERA